MNTLSMGIIGGSDGPTAILVSRQPAPWVIPALTLAALAIIAVSVWQARKKK